MEYIEPLKIMECINCDNERNILLGNPCQTGFDHSCCMKLKKNGYIILDFGRELHGGITITTLGVSGNIGECRIVFGESLMEAKSEIGQKNAVNAHSLRDMKIKVPAYCTQPYGETGFRFVKIEALDADIEIKAVKARSLVRDIPYAGTFTCNDERLNEIWEAAAYTMRLNMQEYIWDGIKRDRDVWIGDMHPEVSTIRTVFGQDEVVKKSLDYVRDDTPEGAWMNGILTYSMWWIIIHHDWYMHYGDYDYLSLQKDYLKKVIDQTIAWIDNGYSFENVRMFLDWSSRGLEDEVEGIKAVVCIALKCAGKIFGFLDEAKYRDRCLDYHKRMLEEEIWISTNRRVSALVSLAGKKSPNSEISLCDDSAEEMSCFMGYYVLLAKAKAGMLEGALNVIRKYWGAMLDMGATTFWEDFDIRWIENAARIDEETPEGKKDIHGDFGRFCYEGFRHSLCHGWASGPAAFLLEELPGITILEPGCKKIKVEPKLGDLEWYHVSYPTPYGNVNIKCRKNNGEIETEITAPAEVEID